MLSSGELSDLWQKHAAALLLLARGRCGRIAGTAAEDCVQEAFIRLARQHPAPQEPSAWLLVAVRNAAIDAVRSHQRRVGREQIAARDRQRWFESVDAAHSHASPEDVQVALRTLDDSTRDILVARLWNDMSFRQIAEALEMSHATVHRRYESGIEQLRAVMTADHRHDVNSVGTAT